ncbi:MAG: sensor N-terminal transmembrane domain-containing protein [Proteobacteria bacterium]|nr:sensor N-terminal transmembrane domain-containing protein [Pseudomonadota bacterium]
MASDIAIERAEPTVETAGAGAGATFESRRRSLPFIGSRLGRLIVLLNLVGLLILIGGSLALNEFRRGLIDTRKDSLTVQGQLIANVIAEMATQGEPSPALEPGKALLAFQKSFVPKGQRARLFDRDANLLADSYLVSDAVEVSSLPPARNRTAPPPKPQDPEKAEKRLREAHERLNHEIEIARTGQVVQEVRTNELGEQVVSVAVPVARVRGVVGVLVLEAGDLEKLIAAQRRALAPFILVALATTIVSSLLLHVFVVRPIQRLSDSADLVRLQRARAMSLPDLQARNDELGDLARSLETMTDTLSNRMDAIERFAADVSHEIKNPLTSVRSAVETLELVKDEAAKARLLALLKQDVRRMDRLITDISNFSRLDAELSRDAPRRIDIARLLEEIGQTYDLPQQGQVAVRFEDDARESLAVLGREGPLGQVFRNLIDNARSFSAPGDEVTVRLERGSDAARPVLVTVDDNGPGVPPENLETIFERFYTSRPKGSAFGANSGLGLSIARQIVLAHGGRIWAQNRVAADGSVIGARFLVALPEAPE